MPDPDALDGGGDGGVVDRSWSAKRILVRDPAQPHDLLHSGRKRQGGRLRDDPQAPGDGHPRQAGEWLAEQFHVACTGHQRSGDDPQ